MQDSDYEYQPFAPRPNSHVVKFSWLGEAWTIFRQGWKPWLVLNLVIGAPLLLTILGIVLAIYFGSSSDSSSGPDSGTSSGSDPSAASEALIGISIAAGMLLAIFILGLIVTCCSSGIALRQVRGEFVRPADIFAGMNRWIPVFLLSILLFPTLLLSSIVLGLGLFVGCGLLMPAYAFAANGESATQAYSKGIAGMKNDWLSASLFCLAYAVIAALGTAITFGLGLLVFVPMMYIIAALAHRDCTNTNTLTPIDYLSGPAHGVWPPAPSAPAQPLSPQQSLPQPGAFPTQQINPETPWRTPGAPGQGQ